MKSRVVLFLCFFISVAFTSDFKLVKSIPAQANFITTDNLGNCYVVKEDVLEKYDENGNLQKTFSNKSLGKITSVDASNAMKILIFYKDFSKIVFLDNTLSQNGSIISLEELQFFRTPLVCSSHNNGIWLYNPENFELVRLDQDLKKQEQTGNIRQIVIPDVKLNPNFLIEYNNKIYLNNPESGVLIFDSYGTFYKNIPIKNIESFQALNDNIVFSKSNFIKTFNTKTLVEDSVVFPVAAISARMEKNKLYLQMEEKVEIYSAK